MTARRAPIAFAALALTLGLAACTSQVGGQANPSSATTGSPPASGTASAGNPFAGLDQCAMVDKALTGEGFPPATPTIARAKETCSSQKPNSGDTKGMVVGLSLQAGQNYKDSVNNPNQASEGSVNGRPAIEEPEPQHSPGQCGVWLEVKPNSRALVLISSDLDTASACKKTEEVAEKIEPLLPKN